MSVPLRLLFQSQHVLVVDKPPGVPFHQSPAGAPGIVQLCRQQQAQGVLPAGSFFPVHRLDTVTSGALVLARDKQTAGLLVRDFRLKRVIKYYVALSDRKPSKKMGSVVGDMQKGRRGSWMLSRTCHNPAVTRFISTAVPGRRPGLRAFLLRPETGKTHQLRVALKSLGAPVLGDARYGQAESAGLEDRGYLHCAAMRFHTPGGLVQVVCQPLEGLEFQSLEFRALFSDWFPADIPAQHGTWFEAHKLLRSSLLDYEDWRALGEDQGKSH